MFSIDVDTGGTFTDGYFAKDGAASRVKVLTTPHDLTVGFDGCLREGAARLGYASLEKMLGEVDVIRLSTTIGTNTLIQRTGPKLGLIVSRGAAADVYGAGEVLDFLVERELVRELSCSISDNGEEITPLSTEEVQSTVRSLLEEGVSAIVVSLRNSEFNDQHEAAIKRIIHAEYPAHHLGRVTVLLASEVTSRFGAADRTSTALMNAYLHPDIVRYLYRAEENLRKQGYPRPLQIVNCQGGVSRVAKTIALDTYGSGPSAGVLGAIKMSELYSLPNLVVFDVGGTSTDISLIRNHEIAIKKRSAIEGITVMKPIMDILSLGVGGGSILGVGPGGTVTVGPRSAGSAPGPMCYGLGGTQPTVTDAALVMGLIDPDYFMGGKRKLKLEAAQAGIQRLCQRLGVSQEVLLARVVDRIIENLAPSIGRLLDEARVTPSSCTLMSFGGAGNLFSALVARRCGIPTVLAAEQASVFSAYGSSTMDVVHVYEKAINGKQDVSEQVATLFRRAQVDMQAEGMNEVQYVCKVEDADGTTSFESRGETAALDTLPDELTAKTPREVGNVISLKVSAALEHQPFVEHVGAGEVGAAQTRQAFDLDTFRTTNVWRYEDLPACDGVAGPAIIECLDTNIVVPQGHSFSKDKHGNVWIKEA
ncbi:MAG: hydantoinase/oxoprolinase family protein [Chloroflexota bacterium]|nr:MAG: hydantoinase/oxoprolinase family protein [Chloroflexota bacterium]